MADYVAPIQQNLPFQNLPSQATPVKAEWLNGVEAALADVAGSPGRIRYYKVLAASPDLLIVGTITRDANEAATTAPVVWPDGTAGIYAATTLSTAFPGAVDAYTITYGSPATLTFTQSAVTRDAAGAVTARPAITAA
jgi:hypothetical protein